MNKRNQRSQVRPSLGVSKNSEKSLEIAFLFLIE